MRRRRVIDRFFRYALFLAAFSSVAILLGIFTMLLVNGSATFKEVNFLKFLFGGSWNPAAYHEPSYGIMPMLVSTFLTTLGAMMIAVPLGIGTAAFLSEFAPHKIREIVKPLIEMLAAIPSVAIGFIGIVVVGPILSRVFGIG